LERRKRYFRKSIYIRKNHYKSMAEEEDWEEEDWEEEEEEEY
jgi:hypothetical protein